MRAWTLHEHPERPPALIPEGFSWGAFLLGPFWLLWHRCWIAGIAALALLAALSLLPGLFGLALPLAAQLLLGLHGRDLRRWTLERSGWRLGHVVLGEDEEGATARLLRLVPALRERWR